MVFVVVVKSSGYIGSRRIGGGLITRNSGRDCSGLSLSIDLYRAM